MALTAEFSGGEFASFEFALDPREYVDVEAAADVRFAGTCDTALAIGINGTCNLAFVGDGSIGSITGVVGNASLGVADEPDYTALYSSYGEGAIEFDGQAYQALIAEMSPASALRWLTNGATGYKIGVDATATLSFISFAEPAGPEDASSRWLWTSKAVTNARASMFGFAALAFQADGKVQGVKGFKGTNSLRFSAQPRFTAVASVSPSSLWRFVSSGRVVTVKAFDALAQWDWAAVAALALRVRMNAQAAWTWQATADGYARLITRTQGDARLRFRAMGYAGYDNEVDAVSSLSFMGRAYTAVVESRSPLARLCLQSFAQPSAVILPYLPSSRTQFTVPERHSAFRVPPEAQLEEV